MQNKLQSNNESEIDELRIKYEDQLDINKNLSQEMDELNSDLFSQSEKITLLEKNLISLENSANALQIEVESKSAELIIINELILKKDLIISSFDNINKSNEINELKYETH